MKTIKEIIIELLEARGDYNINIIEIRPETERLTIARVSYDWKLNCWEKHVEQDVYVVLKDSGEYELAI